MSAAPSSLQSVLNAWLAAKKMDIHTAVPGVVVDYDPARSTITAHVNPVPLGPDGVPIEIPDLERVPVLFPSGGKFRMTWPIRKGDGVLLIFSELDIGRWKRDVPGKVATERRFPLDGAVAIPGLWSPASAHFSGMDEDQVNIQHGSVTLKFSEDAITWDAPGGLHVTGDLTVDGEVKASGNVTAAYNTSLVSLLGHYHPTGVGPSGPPTPGA